AEGKRTRNVDLGNSKLDVLYSVFLTTHHYFWGTAGGAAGGTGSGGWVFGSSSGLDPLAFVSAAIRALASSATLSVSLRPSLISTKLSLCSPTTTSRFSTPVGPTT